MLYLLSLRNCPTPINKSILKHSPDALFIELDRIVRNTLLRNKLPRKIKYQFEHLLLLPVKEKRHYLSLRNRYAKLLPLLREYNDHFSTDDVGRS